MVLTAAITVESKIIVRDVSALRFLCSFRSSKVFRFHYYFEYKFNGSNKFIRIDLLNFMTQLPLPVYLNQVYSVAFYIDLPLKLKKFHHGLRIFKMFTKFVVCNPC